MGKCDAYATLECHAYFNVMTEWYMAMSMIIALCKAIYDNCMIVFLLCFVCSTNYCRQREITLFHNLGIMLVVVDAWHHKPYSVALYWGSLCCVYK